MALNPIAFTEKIVRSFLRYQLTTYPFADPRLLEQMRKQLSLGHERQAPLLRGPYISLSQAFRQGASVDELIRDGVLHPHLRRIIPPQISHVYGHQERALRSIRAGQTTLVSTGTGSGKTECFLYPIISQCLELRDAHADPGICAVIVYPMNALAEDQLDRLRGLLAGTQIPFAMYVGKTPEEDSKVTGERLPLSSSNSDYWARLNELRSNGDSRTLHPPEEICSREMLRTPGKQPRILLTNVKQLELLLTRSVDVQLFTDARLDYLVFDEAHTFTGAMGAETACLVRRLRAFCQLGVSSTTCVATSATIVDERDPNAARNFAARFFGVDPQAVATVHEEYQAEEWRLSGNVPPEPKLKLAELLDMTLAAVDAADREPAIRRAFEALTSQPLADGDWSAALFDALKSNDIAAKIRTELRRPNELGPLISRLSHSIGRNFSEEELLCYLTLGAEARQNERPLFRPVVHAFVRGITGGVVSFPRDQEPQLSLSTESELSRGPDADKWWRPRTHTCTTCGQHYFVSWLKDFEFTKSSLDGGQLAEGGSTYWEALDETNGGNRVVLVDRLICEDDDLDDDDASASLSKRLKPLFFCRVCGSAHRDEFSRCSGCGAMSKSVRLLVVRNLKDHPGWLSSCVSCGARGRPRGRRYREPIREVRAVNVSDVHVLAQDMIQHSERKRLLVFADNRQDAAFQAGWMKDHARRFRLRSLMAEFIKSSTNLMAPGELARTLSKSLENDEALSRALLPEVWIASPREGNGLAHADERTYFLRIQVLREITTAANQQIGLEPWGRLKLNYIGLSSAAPFIRSWAQRLRMPADDLRSGIEALLDHLRRQRLLHDPERQLFGRYWHESAEEIQRGYMPEIPKPKGMKLRATPHDKKTHVAAWIGERNTFMRQVARKWNVDSEATIEFLEELWQFLTSPEVRLLVPVTLLGSKGRELPGCSGVYQLDSTRMTLEANHGFYRCQRCRRKTLRRTPYNRCLAWQCDGELEFVPEEDKDNYNLQLLDERYSLLRPEEHTAMVPQTDRERFENLFKGTSDAVNTLVCTPTLELGVDIGALDAVLLRNVPPLPANYWQRAGRAGRRHRMAVIVSYCRTTSHDRAYFDNPLKMLEGRVDPPAFNLRNELMISKHVHAAVLTRLNQLARSSALTEVDRQRIDDMLRACFPRQISTYLFDEQGRFRTQAYSVAALGDVLKKHRDDVLEAVSSIFSNGWPEKDADVTTATALATHLDQMPQALEYVLHRLRRRLRWALSELERLERIRLDDRQGTLDREDETHHRRCDQLVKKLKGMQTRKRRDAEGVDDINTFNVLALEGFLPGYGLETGSVIGMAEVPFYMGGMEFELPRPSSVAIREYVPGNLLYANGHKFVARRFHFDVDQQQVDAPWFEVIVKNNAVIETGVPQTSSTLSSKTLQALAVCDVDLRHASQIADDEESRFQLPVAIYGVEQGRHSGGTMFGWGAKQLSLRRGVHLRLVNVGASSLVDKDAPELGYPVCQICGQSVSPLSSEAQVTDFRAKHDERCHKPATSIGFYADVIADALTFPSCPDQQTAYSLMECLRIAASNVLEMHIEDLQVLVIGHVDRTEVDALLWDPMPGGSGLLQQVLANFERVFTAACEVAEHCPSGCGTSCVDCLQTFRNGFYHKHLDRHVAFEQLKSLGPQLVEQHDIPNTLPVAAETSREHRPTNDAETRLMHLLNAAGLTTGRFQEQIRFKTPLTLNAQIGSTTPDVFFVGSEDDPDDRGFCLYLDGLSDSIHGNPQIATRDHEIRDWLRNNGYQVAELTAVELDDKNAMVRCFKRIAHYLDGRELAQRLGSDTTWF